MLLLGALSRGFSLIIRGWPGREIFWRCWGFSIPSAIEDGRKELPTREAGEGGWFGPPAKQQGPTKMAGKPRLEYQLLCLALPRIRRDPSFPRFDKRRPLLFQSRRHVCPGQVRAFAAAEGTYYYMSFRSIVHSPLLFSADYFILTYIHLEIVCNDSDVSQCRLT